MTDIQRHNEEIKSNLEIWESKPLLKEVYASFYHTIIMQLNKSIPGPIVEIGSGIGNIKRHIPTCICTDLFPNPWIDRIENAYSLTFNDKSVSNIILFDVFHHLKYPGEALREFNRVLVKNGKVIIFEPCLSLLGLLVYGLFHAEPIGLFKSISFYSKDQFFFKALTYYAAQGNAYRIFRKKSKFRSLLSDWEITKFEKLTSISYVASGGFRRKALYPIKMLWIVCRLDSLAGYFPFLFATRLLVTITKK